MSLSALPSRSSHCGEFLFPYKDQGRRGGPGSNSTSFLVRSNRTTKRIRVLEVCRVRRWALHYENQDLETWHICFESRIKTHCARFQSTLNPSPIISFTSNGFNTNLTQSISHWLEWLCIIGYSPSIFGWLKSRISLANGNWDGYHSATTYWNMEIMRSHRLGDECGSAYTVCNEFLEWYITDGLECLWLHHIVSQRNFWNRVITAIPNEALRIPSRALSKGGVPHIALTITYLAWPKPLKWEQCKITTMHFFKIIIINGFLTVWNAWSSANVDPNPTTLIAVIIIPMIFFGKFQ